MRDLLEKDDPAAVAAAAPSEALGALDAVLAASVEGADDFSRLHLLAPCDLQAVKACGVTFARSMLERVIEERAKGDPARARAIRDQVAGIVGGALSAVKPGSEQAARTKALLQDAGYWSQYLEVGIGPDAEVFTKAQPLSAVGPGAAIGILRVGGGSGDGGKGRRNAAERQERAARGRLGRLDRHVFPSCL